MTSLLNNGFVPRNLPLVPNCFPPKNASEPFKPLHGYRSKRTTEFNVATNAPIHSQQAVCLSRKMKLPPAEAMIPHVPEQELALTTLRNKKKLFNIMTCESLFEYD